MTPFEFSFIPLSPPNPGHSFIKRLEEMDVSRCLTVLILDSSFDEKMILHAAYLTVILLLIILVIILIVILWKRRSRPGTLSIDYEVVLLCVIYSLSRISSNRSRLPGWPFNVGSQDLLNTEREEGAREEHYWLWNINKGAWLPL